MNDQTDFTYSQNNPTTSKNIFTKPRNTVEAPIEQEEVVEQESD